LQQGFSKICPKNELHQESKHPLEAMEWNVITIFHETHLRRKLHIVKVCIWIAKSGDLRSIV
jgi:hypothetical protein